MKDIFFKYKNKLLLFNALKYKYCVGFDSFNKLYVFEYA